MIYFRRLRVAYLYCYFVIVLLAAIACVQYTLISAFVRHSVLVVICFNAGTILTAVVWTILAALALLFCSTTLHTVCAIFGYLYSAVLLCLLVAGHSHWTPRPTTPAHLAFRIVLASVVIVSWVINFILTNWAMKLRRELEYEGSLLNPPTHFEILTERIAPAPVKNPPVKATAPVKKPPEEAPTSVKRPPEQVPTPVKKPPEEAPTSVKRPPEQVPTPVKKPPEEAPTTVKKPPEQVGPPEKLPSSGSDLSKH